VKELQVDTESLSLRVETIRGLAVLYAVVLSVADFTVSLVVR
jgi:hypothetical protein